MSDIDIEPTERWDPKEIELTDEVVMKEDSFPGRGLRTAVNVRTGEKLLLKTTIFFVDDTNEFLNGKTFDETNKEWGGHAYETDYELARNHFQKEESAYNLGRALGVSMPRAEFLDFNGTPIVVYHHLGDVSDHSYGAGFEIAADDPQRTTRETELAKGAFMKVIANMSFDCRQYLTDSKGRIYLTDAVIGEMSPTANIDPRKLLAEIALQGVQGYGAFAVEREALTHQIQGILSQEFKDTLKKAKSMTMDELIETLKVGDNPLDKETIQSTFYRMKAAIIIFELFQKDPQNAIDMIDSKSERITEARMAVFKALQEFN